MERTKITSLFYYKAILFNLAFFSSAGKKKKTHPEDVTRVIQSLHPLSNRLNMGCATINHRKHAKNILVMVISQIHFRFLKKASLRFETMTVLQTHNLKLQPASPDSPALGCASFWNVTPSGMHTLGLECHISVVSYYSRNCSVLS